ncbi:hypothetical protein WA158_007249 [Blastocystis sp. Blastoise]
MDRTPCPWRLLDDTGGAFMMGAIGGAMWHLYKGARNSPKGTRISGAISAIKTRAPVLGGSFAVWGLLYSACDCSLAAIRRKEDPFNSILSGGLSGGLLALRGGLKAFSTNFLVGCGMLALIEGANMWLTKSVQTKVENMQEEAFGKNVLALTPPHTNTKEFMTANVEKQFVDESFKSQFH